MKTILSILIASALSCAAQVWNFNTPSDTNIVVVSPGAFSAGWFNSIPSMGTNSGFWDLGQQGFVAAQTDVPAINATVLVDVTVWIDGGIFPTPTIAVAGTLLGSTVTTNSTGSLGSWQTISTVWQVTGNAQTVVVVSQPDPTKGCLVDRIAVGYAVPRQPQPKAIALPKASEDCEAE